MGLTEDLNRMHSDDTIKRRLIGQMEMAALEVVVAQLRHAYQQLMTEPDRSWDIRARSSFADGLLAPQIAKLEAILSRGTSQSGR